MTAKVYAFPGGEKKREVPHVIDSITYGDVFDLYANQSFLRLLQHQQRSDVTMAMASIHKELGPVMKAFDAKREEVAKSFAEKGTTGNPIIEKGVYLILPDRQFEFNEEIAMLKSVVTGASVEPIELKITECVGVVAMDLHAMAPFVTFAR